MPRTRSFLKVVVWVACALVALVIGAPARAADKRVAVYTAGPDFKAVSEAVARLLPSGVSVEKTRFTRELQKGGPLGPNFDKSPRLGARVKKAMQKANVEAAVLAKTTLKKRERVVHVLVFKRGSDKPAVDESVVLGKKNTDSEWVSLNDAVLPALSDLESAPEPEPEAKPKSKSQAKASKEKKEKAEAKPEPEPEEEATAAAEPEEEAEEPEPAEKPSEAAPKDTGGSGKYERNRALVILGLAPGGGGRKFAYDAPVTPGLRSYSTWNLPLLAFRLEAYPLAKKPGFAQNFGVTGGLTWALPAGNEGADGESFDSKYLSFEAGLRYRIPISRAAVGIAATFGKESFSFDGDGEIYNDIAGVDYSYLRLGVDGRIPVSSLFVLIGAGYRVVLSGGTVADNFRDTSLSGFDARIGPALPFGKDHFEVSLLARYTRYAYSMSPQPADPFIADGATDQFFALELGLSYAF